MARRKTDGYLPHQLPLASPSRLLRRLQRDSHRSLLLITRRITTLTRAKRTSPIVSFLMVFGITYVLNHALRLSPYHLYPIIYSLNRSLQPFNFSTFFNPFHTPLC